MGKTHSTKTPVAPPAKNDRSAETRLIESVAFVSESVDAEAGVIRGVKIIGLQSKNGRRYLSEALQRAIPLYQGVKVNLNHPTNPAAPRDYRDRIGFLENVTFSPDGLRGDLRYNPEHPNAKQIAWDAEHAPSNLGLSHNAVGLTDTDRDGTTVVNEITRLHSVDLVADPATTKSLFESERPMADDATKPDDEEEIKPVVEDDTEATDEMPVEEPAVEPSLDAIGTEYRKKVIAWIVDTYGDDTAAMSAHMDDLNAGIALVMKALDMAAADAEVTTEESRPANGGKAIAATKPVVDPNTAKLRSELKALQEQIAVRDRKEEARTARIAKKAKLVEQIKAAKLDPSNEKHVSKAFMESLLASPDAKVKALIEDRASLVRAARGQSPVSSPASGGAEAKSPYSSMKEAVNAWRS